MQILLYLGQSSRQRISNHQHSVRCLACMNDMPAGFHQFDSRISLGGLVKKNLYRSVHTPCASLQGIYVMTVRRSHTGSNTIYCTRSVCFFVVVLKCVCGHNILLLRISRGYSKIKIAVRTKHRPIFIDGVTAKVCSGLRLDIHSTQGKKDEGKNANNKTVLHVWSFLLLLYVCKN